MDNIELKKRNILRWIPLGFDLDEAFLLAECSLEEIEILKADKALLKNIEIYKLCEERRLLILHKKAMKIAAEKGNTQGIQWKLSKIKNTKWGDGKKADEEEQKPLKIMMIPFEKDVMEADEDIDIVIPDESSI